MGFNDQVANAVRTSAESIFPVALGKTAQASDAATDGTRIWGIEYVAASPRSIISGAVIEYLDFTNQSGPTHWAPYDRRAQQSLTKPPVPTHITTMQTQRYTYFGMGLGTPFLPGTIYNRDGYMCYVDTRVRGFHMAAKGWLASNFDYRVMLSTDKDGAITMHREPTKYMTSHGCSKQHGMSAMFLTESLGHRGHGSRRHDWKQHRRSNISTYTDLFTRQSWQIKKTST